MTTKKDISDRIAALSPEKRELFKRRLSEEQTAASHPSAESIAIIGMGCRFPGRASNPSAFWELLKNGFDAVSETPANRWNAENYFDPDPSVPGKANTRWGAYLERLDLFDAAFFGISPLEAKHMDPQQRLLLEIAWEALEDAGQTVTDLAGSRSGVFVGVVNHSSEYFSMQIADFNSVDIYTSTGTAHSVIANRISYQLDLQGPSLVVDTACSSSLVATHLAIQSLRNRESDLALAGGVHLILGPENSIVLTKLNMMATDGHCKTFDARADGFVRGEGCGLVVLKRLDDAIAHGDNILAVVRGSAVNQDGRSNGLTAPNSLAQKALLRQALHNAGVDSSQITYVETHGTGTALGDPIEIEALTEVIGQPREDGNTCILGAVKASIGHLEGASGIAGLIKTVLCLQHRWIPAQLHFEQLNPHIQLEGTPFVIPTKGIPWTSRASRIAGVSAFGVGGTNAHIILEEADSIKLKEESKHPKQNTTAVLNGLAKPSFAQVLPISARSPEALKAAVASYQEFLQKTDALPLEDICFSASTRRSHHEYRFAAVGATSQEIRQHLNSFLQGKSDSAYSCGHVNLGRQPGLVFVFSGQGPQWFGMGRSLFEQEPSFRESIQRCDKELRKYSDWSLLQELSAEESQSRLDQTEFAQPAIFALQLGLASLFRSWGIVPDAVIGHSVGEVAAAHVAGSLSFEDAVRVIFERGRLMQRTTGGGKMASIGLPLRELERALSDYKGKLSVAAVNAKDTTVLSGDPAALEELAQSLEARGVACRKLPVNYAFHSSQMDVLQKEITGRLETIKPRPSSIPIFSTVFGTICDGTEMSASYWWQNIRQPVLFSSSVKEALHAGNEVFLEISPHPVLSASIGKGITHDSKQGVVIQSLHRDQNERSALLKAVGALYVTGYAIDWHKIHPADTDFVKLPLYPWQKKRYWLDQSSIRNNSASEALPAINLQTPTDAMTEQPSSYELSSTPKPTSASVISTPIPQPTAIPANPGRLPRKQRLLQELVPLLQDLSGIDLAAIQPDLTFVEMGFDSLFLTQVSQTFSKKFGVKISIRQMWDELDTLEKISSYMDANAPADPEEHLPVQPAPPPPMVTGGANSQSAIVRPDHVPTQSPVATLSLSREVSTVERILQEQLQIMSRQLELLRGLGTNEARHEATNLAPTPNASVGAKATLPQSAEQSRSPLVAHGPFKPVEKGSTNELNDFQRSFIHSLIRRYTKRTTKSKELTQQHRHHLADPRSVAGFNREWKEMVYPIVVERSSGSKVWDIDGNEYVDFTMGFGTTLLGHSPDFVTASLEQQLRKGIEVGPQTPLAGEVAALMCDLTGMERCAFCNTGSEAVLAAIRMARTVTGRDLIVYFSGDYHGICDELLQRPSGSGRGLIPIAPGIPASPVSNVLILEYDRPESLEIIRTRGSEIAAVIVEPVQSRHPNLQPRGFLHQLREVTLQVGSALVFDELITGFRSHPGGVQALFGVRADIATYGKIIGGGMPIGAVCGSAKYLDALDGGFWQYGDSSVPEVGVTFFAGTYVRHPLALAAARATLQQLKNEGPALQEQLGVRMGAVVNDLRTFLSDHEVPIRIEHFSSFFSLSFDPKLRNASLLFFLLRDKGIHIFEGRVFFLSTAHTADDANRLIVAFKESVHEMVVAGFLPGRFDPSGPDHDSTPHSDTSEEPKSLSVPLAVHSSLAVKSSANNAAKPAEENAHTSAPVKIGIYFFGSYPAPFAPDKYELIVAAAKQADKYGFSAIWIPERHFHAVGGFSPNPAVIAAALCRETQQIQLRAGSVVLPIHNPIRVAEEWSVVDNLSGGRVGLSIASGWHANDFVFAPTAFEKRREISMEGVDIIRKLWSGQSIEVRGGQGNSLNVSLHPMPAQPELPMWLTCVSTPSYQKAGELGVGVLAMLANQSLDELAKKIALYRSSLATHGHHPSKGNVTILIHTFVAADPEDALSRAREPMRHYLRSYLDNSQKRFDNGNSRSPLDKEDLEYLLDRSVEDYIRGKTLIGSPDTCLQIVQNLRRIGVDELGCFLDFGVDSSSVLQNLPHLAELKRRVDRSGVAATESLTQSIREKDEIQIRGDDVDPIIPLSEAQQGFMLLTKIAPEANRAYMECSSFELHGSVDLEVLKRALQFLVDRHEALRTTLDPSGRTQTVHRHLDLYFPVIDLSSMPEVERRAKLAEQFTEIESLTFDLVQGPILDFRIIRLAEHHHLLILMLHHFLGNGPSYEVLMKELNEVYEAMVQARKPGLGPAMQLSDYVIWLEQQSNDPSVEADRKFWLAQFPNGVPVLDLPTDHPRPAIFNYRGGRYTFMLDPAVTASLRKISKELKSSLFVTLFAAFNILLHRLSGQHDLIVGVPFEGKVRGVPGGENLYADTTNMLPLRSRFEPSATFRDFASATKSLLFDASEHQSYFFGRLTRDLKLHPDPSRPPIIAASFNIDPPFRKIAGVLQFEPVQDGVPFGSPSDTSKFELNINIVDRIDQLRVDCEFSSELFESSTIASWLSCYRTLLQGIIANTEAPLSSLPIVEPDKSATLVNALNRSDSSLASQLPFDGGATLHQLFEKEAARHPESVALIFEGQSLTYGRLNSEANRLGRRLVDWGVKSETIVGLRLDRSSELIIAILAILKAGGAYLPIDLNYPPDRLSFMLNDAQAPLLLTHKRLLADLPALASKILCMDDLLAEDSNSEQEKDLPPTAGPDNLAYVIYTSGTTGKPKGTLITHRNVSRLFAVTDNWYRFNEHDVWTMFHSYAFDFSVWEVWGALLYGGRLIIVPFSVSRSPEDFYKLLVRERVTVLNQTPSAFRQLIQAEMSLGQGNLALRYVIFGGEALEMQSLRPWFDRHGDQQPRLVNMYGITETTVHVSYRPLSKNDLTSGSVLGTPLPDLQIHILDPRGQPVPIGVPGEIYIGGPGLARGYLHRPELTNERFVPDHISGRQGRLYRSGDLARGLPDGDIEYLGRLDQQVKIRGLRIELGEIQSVIGEFPGVRQSAVICREDAPGDKRLVAYLIAGSSPVVIDDLRTFLRARLPEYMVPAHFVSLDAIPLTGNGKIDVKALPPPDLSRSNIESALVKPRTPVEQTLATIWSDVLRVREVGIHDNFFDLGGDSILNIQILTKAKRAGLRLTASQVFQYQTIAELAAKSEELQAVNFSQGEVVGDVPLTPIQHHFFEQDVSEPHHWNMSVILELQRAIAPEVLRQAVREVIGHHDSFRLRFTRTAQGWHQYYSSSDEPVSFEYLDLSKFTKQEQFGAMRAKATDIQSTLDLSTGPLIRTALLHYGPGRPSHFLIVAHHLVIDGISWRILFEDLQAACEQIADGHGLNLPAKTTSFKFWSEQMALMAQSPAIQKQRDYWFGPSRWDAHPIPVDFTGRNNTSQSSDVVQVSLNEEDTRALLQRVPAAYNTQMDDVLLTAVAMAFADWTGDNLLLVDVEGHGREQITDSIDLTRTIGWFTSISPLLLRLPAAARARDLTETLLSVKRQRHQIPNHGIGYGLLRYLAKDVRLSEKLKSQPQAEVAFNYLGQFDQQFSQDSIWGMFEDVGRSTRSALARRRYLIEIDAVVYKNQLRIDWTYCREIHKSSTIQNLAERFRDSLNSLVLHCLNRKPPALPARRFTESGLSQEQLDNLIREIG